MATIRPTPVGTCSQDYLVGCIEVIEGSKLPSAKQVFGHFLHRRTILKEDVRTAANSTIERVESFWFKAKIPVRHRQDSIKQLEQIFYQWRGLKKNKNRHTET